MLHAPNCKKRPHQLHGPEGVEDVREDSYYWLRDDERTDPAVLEHLKVLYCWAAMQHAAMKLAVADVA